MLEDIGFYTLYNKRAMNCSRNSDLQRCELIITDRCNFKCPYCRGIENKYRGDIPIHEAYRIIDEWGKHNLKAIRFSGGEPTLHNNLIDFVKIARSNGCSRISISTNGSADIDHYHKLLDAGVNDLSISFDACCSSTCDKMSGRVGMWEKIMYNITQLSALTYTTVGVVLNENNINEVNNIIVRSHELGVQDIRIIPSAQYNRIGGMFVVSQDILAKHPILNYRHNRIKNGKPFRGISEADSHRCRLVLDDMAVLGGYHFPCVIYMREQGKPIGMFDNIERIRSERERWMLNTNTYLDPICRKNCLDVCVAYNNVAEKEKTYNID